MFLLFWYIYIPYIFLRQSVLVNQKFNDSGRLADQLILRIPQTLWSSTVVTDMYASPPDICGSSCPPIT